MKTTPYTSTQLHKEHPDIYEQFFSEHSKILSAPLTIRRASIGIIEKEQIPTLFSQLPLKIYLGINPKNELGVSIDKVISYEFTQDKFIEQTAITWEYKLQSLVSYLQQYLETEKSKQGRSISLLIEGQKHTGTGVFGSIAACCAARLLDSCNDYQEIFILGQTLEKQLKGNHASGDRIIAAAIASSYSMINGLSYKEIECHQLPFDAVIVYSGVPGDISRAPVSKKNVEEKLNHYDIIVASLFEKVKSKNKDMNFSDSVQHLLHALHNIFTSYILGYIAQQKPAQEIASLIATQQLIAEISAYILDEHLFIDTMLSNSDENHKYGIFPLFSGIQGGSYLICLPYGLYRGYIEEKIQRTKQQFPSLKTLHKSWEISETSSLMIEQNLLNQKRSIRTKHDNYIYRNNQGIQEVGNAQELKKKRSQGILLDTIERKIYANGEKLTSKYFESQTTTIEVLELCLESAEKNISNTSLSYSTLTRQYNQFLGKIIAPLRKMTKEFFGKDIEIETHGSLREFTIQLREKEIVIGLLKKI